MGLTLDVAKDKPYVDLVKAVTKSDVDFSKKPVIRSGAADWFMKFWHVKNVHDNWFVVGMVGSIRLGIQSYVSAI